MALATPEDVEVALGRTLTEAEQEAVENQLEEASDLVLGYLRCPPTEPTPSAISRVVASMVAALIARPPSQPLNAEQLNAGQYGARFTEGSTSNSPWLTSGQKMRLAPYRCSMMSVPLVSERYSS